MTVPQERLIRDLTGRLVEAEAALSAAVTGGVDSVVTPGGESVLLRVAQSALLVSETRHRRLLGRMSAVVLELDGQGLTQFVNDAIVPVTGSDPEELLGRSWWDVMCPGDLRPGADALWARLREEDVTRAEMRIRGKSGQEAVLELTSANRYSASGALVAVLGFAMDVTARRRAEEQARRQSAAATEALARLAAIVEGSGDAIYGVDLSGSITSWNEAATELYGYSEAEAVGQPIAMLQPEGGEGELKRLVERILEGRHVRGYETERLRRDGQRVEVALTYSPIRDARRSITGVAIIARSITERRLLEAQFRQAQKMEAVGRLAGGIAHDFNNLLTVINGYAGMLVGQAGGGFLRDALQQILEAGERAASLTRQLLAFSRKQVLVPEVIDLNTLIRNMERMLQRLIGEDIEVVLRAAEDLRSVRIDPTHMQQVVMNLAVNARDAMPQGGRLAIETGNLVLEEGQVSAVPAGCYVTLSVTDTGHGMDEGTLAHLFEPFFTTKGPQHGTGLGLATVYGIVQQSGGYLDVESRVGEGSRFRIFLPPVGAEGSGDPHDASTARLGGETVLVVEDDDLVRKLARTVLERCGYRVLESGDARKASELSNEHHGPIHLLLTDVVLPRASGPQLAQALMALRPEMRVLFMSGYADNAGILAGAATSPLAFLQKPFTPRGLSQRVRGVLDVAPQVRGSSIPQPEEDAHA